MTSMASLERRIDFHELAVELSTRYRLLGQFPRLAAVTGSAKWRSLPCRRAVNPERRAQSSRAESARQLTAFVDPISGSKLYAQSKSVSMIDRIVIQLRDEDYTFITIVQNSYFRLAAAKTDLLVTEVKLKFYHANMWYRLICRLIRICDVMPDKC